MSIREHTGNGTAEGGFERGRAGRLMSGLGAPGLLIWRRRGLLARTAASDLRARFAGSVLGPAWLLLYPLFFLAAYAAIHVFVYRLHPEGSRFLYVATIFCGLVPFLAFAESLGMGVSAVTGNANLVKNTLFPIDLVPVKTVLVSQSSHVVGLAILLVALGATGHLSAWALLLPVAFAAQLLLVVGVVWIFASLNVFLRDLQTAVSILTLALMMVSPIAYTTDMVPGGLKSVLMANPLYYVIVTYRGLLMGEEFPAVEFLGLAALAALFFCGGFSFFTRLKGLFADNV